MLLLGQNLSNGLDAGAWHSVTRGKLQRKKAIPKQPRRRSQAGSCIEKCRQSNYREEVSCVPNIHVKYVH